MKSETLSVASIISYFAYFPNQYSERFWSVFETPISTLTIIHVRFRNLTLIDIVPVNPLDVNIYTTSEVHSCLTINKAAI